MKNLKHLSLALILLVLSVPLLTGCAPDPNYDEAANNAASNDCCGRTNANIFVVTNVSRISGKDMVTARQIPVDHESADEVNFFSDSFHVGDTLHLETKDKILTTETSYE